MKRYLQDYLLLILIAGVIVILDQLTKFWIRQNLLIGEVYRPELWVSNYARIVHWKNTGAAFGMFQSLGGVFTVLSFIVGAVIVYYFPQISRQDWLIRLAMGMLLAGAIGNLIDRLTQGYVIDFISVGNFPVFNVADSSISVGVAVLFIGMWVQEKRKKPEPDPDAQEVPGSEASGIPEEMQGE